MDFTKMFMGGAVVGTIITCWTHIKGVMWKCCNVAVKKININNDLRTVLLVYVTRHYKTFYIHDKVYSCAQYFIKSKKNYEHVSYEDFSNISMFFYNNKKSIPFYINSQHIKGENGNPGKQHTTLYYIRGSINPENIIHEAINYWNKIGYKFYYDNDKKSNFYIKYVPGKQNGNATQDYDLDRANIKITSHNIYDIGFLSKKNSINNLILSNENKEIIKLADLWKKNKDWYQKKDIPWKMGWLLHGPPGTGKTSLARSVAEYLDIPLFVYKLNKLDDSEFSEAWSNMQSSTPCLALIEDFDNVFHGREYIASSMYGFESIFNSDKEEQDKNNSVDKTHKKRRHAGYLTFDNFLNTLDGAERYEGVFTIITTNCIDKIDSALLNRPGRIDKVMELTYLTDENKQKLIEKILGDMPVAKQNALEYIRLEKKQLTPAQLQEKCSELALRELYNG